VGRVAQRLGVGGVGEIYFRFRVTWVGGERGADVEVRRGAQLFGAADSRQQHVHARREGLQSGEGLVQHWRAPVHSAPC